MISIISINLTSIGTSEDDVERLVAAMDVDGDGKVTYQEYLNSFRSDADAADADAETYADKGNGVRSSRAKGFTCIACCSSWMAVCPQEWHFWLILAFAAITAVLST